MTMPRREDLDWLTRFRKRVAREGDALAALVEEELGKPAGETWVTELLPLITACRAMEKHARRWLATRRVPGGTHWQLGQRHRLMRVPLGKVAIIATWNYPLQLLGVQLAQALVAGNDVTVKPSERTPRSQARLLDLARELGMDTPRLQWVKADRAEGPTLLDRERWDHVIFTGSTEVGRSIAERLASRLIPSTLELSGQDSALVLADADAELAAKTIVAAVRLNGGATCLTPRRVIVADAVADQFEAVFRQQVQDSELSTYLQVDRQRVRDLALEAVAEGGRWIDESMQDEAWSGLYVVADGFIEGGFNRGEHFGPGLALLRVIDDEAALALHERFPQRLSTAVFTRRIDRVSHWAGRLGSGFITINDCVVPTAHPGAPLAAQGSSGWGLTRGREGLIAMTRPVVVSRTRYRLRWPTTPPTGDALRKLSAWAKWWYG